MIERTLDLSWMRLAVAGLLVCLALLMAVVIFMPAQAQSGCVEWDDHGNCVAWEETGLIPASLSLLRPQPRRRRHRKNSSLLPAGVVRIRDIFLLANHCTGFCTTDDTEFF